ncbi:hypothetical protein LCGC14_0501080 [marine sediment metagenome]|uniref:Uncharacterized protein n=1 Tax=marine sediment metagenome TaxID=412755 RepID=A0A0F9VCI2_9ZZZZ|nr:hypothetical protein [Pricia sp.]
MNRKDARKIAETITNEQLQKMFDEAKKNITDWTVVSICNKGMTKGVAWNILAKNFDVNEEHHILGKTNMVREFGDFLSPDFKPKKVKKPQGTPPTHQDPIFN